RGGAGAGLRWKETGQDGARERRQTRQRPAAPVRAGEQVGRRPYCSDSMKPIIYTAWSFRGATEGGEPGIHIARPVVMDSGLAASDLGFTRDRHYTMRTSATADVRWRPGMTPRMIRISKSLQ